MANTNMDELKKKLLPYLKTDFEKDLLDAALWNLGETDNKLRLNNFAYAMRELTRHFLERLAPDDQVRHAPWFINEVPGNPSMITREQRIKYAVQGYLSDEYREKVLKLELQEVSKKLRDSINKLSKYTHVNPDTFDVDSVFITDISYNIMEVTLIFFMTIDKANQLVNKAIDSCIDKDMLSQFYVDTHNELDILATHYEVLSFMVTDIMQIAKDDETITMKADGIVNVRLQYGSDGDLLRDNGYEMEIPFPFTSEFVVNYKNQEGDIHIESSTVNVNNDSFYE